jgi:hypothetical protein
MLIVNLPIMWEPFAKLGHSLSTGKTAFDEIHPGESFDYLAEHPEDGHVLDSGVTAKAHGHVSGLEAYYDLRFGTTNRPRRRTPLFRAEQGQHFW